MRNNPLRTALSARGFTLVELMIVVAIAAILAAIAYPSYQDSIRKSRRTEAKTALENVAAEQEKYYYRNNAYTRDLTKLGYSGTAGAGQKNTENGYYRIQVVPDGTGSCGTAAPWHCTKYRVYARPVGPQASDPWIYRLYSDGRKYRCKKRNTTNFQCTSGTGAWDWNES